MPISRTTIENAALSQGFSRGQAKAIARRIVARPDWSEIQSVLAERFWLPHADPTAHEAIWKTLTQQLVANHVEGVPA